VHSCYLDLDEVKHNGHVIDFDVGEVAMTTGFVIFVSDLMSECLLQLQQYLHAQPTNTQKNRKNVMETIQTSHATLWLVYTADTDKTRLSCRRPRCELNWRQVKTVCD